jgi:hypothetical protein
MEQMIMKTPEQVEQLVREAVSQDSNEFRPCAYFDDRLDCIRVIARDCSVCEERVNDRLTVLVDNYHERRPGKMKYIGFTIKGARHFCREQGLDLSAPIRMTPLLDAILASWPDATVMIFVDKIARPLVEQENIQAVEMPIAA